MGLLWAGMGFAQKVTDPQQLPAAVREFDAPQEHASWQCTVEPIKPALNFSFRFQTGYRMGATLNANPAGGRHWLLAFRVTPEGGQRKPIYFTDSIDPPASAPPGSPAQTSGLFLLGAGRYHVNWNLLDESGRVCRKQWTLDARLSRSDRSIQLGMPPDTAADLSWRTRPADAPNLTADGDRDRAPGIPAAHITVLVNAATLNPGRRTGGRGPGSRTMAGRGGPVSSRWATLVGILASLLERLPAASVRLVVFNLNQQKELFRQDGFTTDGISRIAHAGDEAQQWSVDYHVLQHPAGSWDLLAHLVNQEIHSAAPSDLVLFLGMPSATSVKMPAGFPGPAGAPGPRFFYLQCRPRWPARTSVPESDTQPQTPRRNGTGMRGAGPPGPVPGATPLPGELPDSIDQTVRRLKGKSIIIYTPAQFGKAIDEIGHGTPR